VTFCRLVAIIPTVCEPTPAAKPPNLKLLQSMVTLLVLMLMALPVVIAVARSALRH
jgi:hypothetical protein